MLSSEDPLFDYKPGRIYSLDEFEALNDWLKTHDFEVDGTAISHFEWDSEGRLVPMPQTPIEKEAAVAKILYVLYLWNENAGQPGVPTSSQGGFKLGGQIVAPDVAFTPKATYSALTVQQRRSFQGASFPPIFVVEVDDLSSKAKLTTLSNKFKDIYIPNGVRLGWLIDPINKTAYTFTRERDGVIRRRSHSWTVLNGGRVLPGFALELGDLDKTTSQLNPAPGPAPGASHPRQISCNMCDKTFLLKHKFIQHFQDAH